MDVSPGFGVAANQGEQFGQYRVPFTFYLQVWLCSGIIVAAQN